MEFMDFIKALSKKIYDFTGKEVGIDNINALTRPCYYIQVIDYKNEFFANYKKRIFISVDIMYIPENDENNTMEVYKALDELDNMFETKGNKILKVKDRNLTLKNERTKVVDGLGHYMFDLDLFDVYGIDLRSFDNNLEMIKEVLKELDLEDIALIGLVKDDKHKTKEIISKEGKNISASPKLLKVLTNMQEEVHNLAIGYHREKRDKDITKSKLDSIKGIGEEKKKELLREFKTVENISNATIEELSKVKGITERIAQEILNTLHN